MSGSAIIFLICSKLSEDIFKLFDYELEFVYESMEYRNNIEFIVSHIREGFISCITFIICFLSVIASIMASLGRCNSFTLQYSKIKNHFKIASTYFMCVFELLLYF